MTTDTTEVTRQQLVGLLRAALEARASRSYWAAARAETARVVALRGERLPALVVRVDGELSEQQDDRQESDWLQREEDADLRDLCAPMSSGIAF